MDQHPLVSVGMPTYNRPELLQRSLDSIRAQTYRHLEIIVSDNASPDPRVGQLISSAFSEDQRIRHFRQQKNIGPAGNFAFVLNQARGTFFMWAADDDEWNPAFVEKLLETLQGNPKSGLSFCDFDVRYPDGSLCLDYGSFYHAYSEFIHDDGVKRVTHYAMQAPERGKANLIYGLYRREALNDASVNKLFYSKAWGADMLFVCDVLSRWSFSLVADKLYTVGIHPQAPSPPGDVANVLPPGTKSHRRQLLVSHLQYFLIYVRIMHKAPDAGFLSAPLFFFRLLPLMIRRMRMDLA